MCENTVEGVELLQSPGDSQCSGEHSLGLELPTSLPAPLSPPHPLPPSPPTPSALMPKTQNPPGVKGTKDYMPHAGYYENRLL